LKIRKFNEDAKKISIYHFYSLFFVFLQFRKDTWL